jgi:hypothetical protein
MRTLVEAWARSRLGKSGSLMPPTRKFTSRSGVALAALRRTRLNAAPATSRPAREPQLLAG